MKQPFKRPDLFWALPSVHVPLDIGQVSEFPVLAACLDAWRSLSDGGLPKTIDPTEVPPAAIKGISLADWSEAHQDWILRLSSTLIDESHGRPMKGTTFSEVFLPDELEKVHGRLRAILASGEPDLARHEFTDPSGRVWSFVRLILPLADDGDVRWRFCLVHDPDTFGRRIARQPKREIK